MRKYILLVLIVLFLGVETRSWAQWIVPSPAEVSGVVTSFSPYEIRISQKYAPGHYFLYIFKLTKKTRIFGLVQKWSFVRVKYYQKEIIGGFTTTAQEIQVVHPPNTYYQRMY